MQLNVTIKSIQSLILFYYFGLSHCCLILYQPCCDYEDLFIYILKNLIKLLIEYIWNQSDTKLVLCYKLGMKGLTQSVPVSRRAHVPHVVKL